MKGFAVVVVSVALLGVAGCGGSDSGSSSDDQAAIEALASQYAQTALDGDFAATCKLLTPESLKKIDDIKVFGSCEELMKTGLGGLPDDEVKKLGEITNLEVNGDTATAEARGETVNFEKVNGEWKLAVNSGDE